MNHIIKLVNLELGSIEDKREEIKEYFLQTYTLYEKLFDLLEDEKFIYEPSK